MASLDEIYAAVQGRLPSFRPEMAGWPNSEGYLAMLQHQLFDTLGVESGGALSAALGDLEEFSSARLLQLAKSRKELEILLSSGECGPSSNSGSRDNANECQRWRRALALLLRILALDPAAVADEPGELWRFRLATATALTFCEPRTRMADKQPIDPLQRYTAFRDWQLAGCLCPGFAKLTAWEMRYVVQSWCDETELEWARSNVRDDCRDRKCLGQAHCMVQYRDKNSVGESVHGPNFYGGRPITLAEMAATGGVCGAVSKFTTGVCQAFGAPAMPVGQPGHCAYIWQTADRKWALVNDISGWGKSCKHDDIQICWGDQAWLVPLMQVCQSDFKQYAKSERLRTLAALAGDSGLLLAALKECPCNWPAWLELINAAQLDRQPKDWVIAEWEARQQQENEHIKIEVAHGKRVKACDCHERAANVVDGTGSEWWTGQTTAWLEIDLGDVFHIHEVKIQWWGISVAKRFSLLFAVDNDAPFAEARNHVGVPGPSDEYNGWTTLPVSGAGPARRLRLELADGRMDPWGKNMLFGIRQVLVSGTPARSFADRVPRTAEGLLPLLAKDLLAPEGGPLQADVAAVALAELRQRFPGNTENGAALEEPVSHDSSQPPWTCSACTFEHHGHKARWLACEMCGTERCGDSTQADA
mmetsp:Transcript_30875/g.67596  ORF Transcript_30875/g.67596 Transcript_30875/m.67596 type:complete len:646 (-) Transcript_30875:42-1979(-)